jgi:hypothetical protein
MADTWYYKPPSPWGTTLLAAGGLIQAASSIYSGFLGYQSAKNASKLLEYQAAYAKARGELAETQIRRQLSKIIGTQRAATAAAGIRPDVGTPLELQIETEILNDIDANIARASGGMDSIGFMSAAQQKMIEGLSLAGQGFGRAFGYSFNTLLQLADRRPFTPVAPRAPSYTSSFTANP